MFLAVLAATAITIVAYRLITPGDLKFWVSNRAQVAGAVRFYFLVALWGLMLGLYLERLNGGRAPDVAPPPAAISR